MRALTSALLVLCLAIGAAALASGEGDLAIPSGRDFGAGLSLDRLTDLAQLMADPEAHQDRPVLVKGRISDVCQRKGCWTVLSQGESHLRVRFQDYGFFLPTDCSGKEAYVEGVVQIETLSEKQARHFASESQSADAEKIHGPGRELGMIASGVRLVGLD